MEMKTKIEATELRILHDLDEILKDRSILEVIDSIVAEASKKLIKDKLDSVTQTVPITIFGDKLPGAIHLCRIFILRAGVESKIEKHTNSHQRVMSYSGKGNIKVLIGDNWTSNQLISDKEQPIEKRWLSVKENIWHQPIAEVDNWATVTFHTASESEIIDEYQS